MDELFQGVYRVVPDKVTPQKHVSFFVRRRGGNLLFPCFSSGARVDGSFDEIEQAGGVSMQLLADMHFRSKHNDDVFERFGSPLQCSEPELADTARLVRNVRAFPFERHELAPGVEVLPTPGHRVGGTCFLVTLGKRRYLFAGDEIWHTPADGWRCYASKANRKTMVRSIESLRDVGFDVVLCNAGVDDPDCAIELDDTARRKFLDGLVARL